MAHNHKDTIFYPLFLDKLSTSFQKKQPDHIGLSLNYLSQALSCFALIGTIRELLPQAKIIVGGGLISSWMRSGNWNNPFAGLIDHCIEGCGANFLLSLFGKLPGTEAPSFYEDFDRKRYLSPGFILPYSTSSGCFWNKCNFCPERAEGNLFQIKTPDRVSRELTDLTNTYKPTLLHLLDNAIPPVILQRIISDNRRIPWYGFIRVTDQLLDPDFCKALKTSGCVMLKLGIESGSQLVLDQMEKGISLHKVSRALKNLKVAGIHTYVYLLFGTPAETHEKALQTLRFTVDHQSEISFLNLAIFNMPTNSQERSSVKTSSFSRSDLSLYTDFEHPNGWNRREVRSFLDREFKRTAAISQILRRDPPFFTSNHAPFLCNGSFAQPSKPPTP